MDGDAMRARQAAQHLIGRPAGAARLGQDLRRGEARVAPAAEIGPGLGQGDEVRPVGRRRAWRAALPLDQAQARLEIIRELAMRPCRCPGSSG
jgi:hypothetical protein